MLARLRLWRSDARVSREVDAENSRLWREMMARDHAVHMVGAWPVFFASDIIEQRRRTARAAAEDWLDIRV